MRNFFRYALILWHDPIFRAQQSEVFSQKIVWSTLAKIGRTSLMKLVILEPLIGVFIIFNDGLLSIFRMEKFFLEDVGALHKSENLSIDDFTIRNLYFLYFGLTILGVGSILFNMYCPEEIKKDSYIIDHIYYIDMDRNSVVAKSYLSDILNSYFDNKRDVEADNLPPNPEYPNSIELHFYNLISEMFEKTNQEMRDEYESVAANDEDEVFGSFYLPTGYPNIHEVAKAVWSRPRVIWAFTEPFRGLSTEFARDIAFVRYHTLNHKLYKVRLGIVILYSVGFIIVSIPTAITFVRLLFNVIAN